MMKVLFLLLPLILATLPARAFNENKLIDLTYAFEDGTLHWPTAKPFKLEKVNEEVTPLGFWYASYNYSASEHVGTHLDAPFHFAQKQWTTDAIPLEKTIGPAVVIDVRARAEKDPDYLVRVEDVRNWEKKHGKISPGEIILLHTGWGQFWGDRKRYFGTDETGDASKLHFPGISKEAAEFLVKDRRIDAIGIDTPSIDHGLSRDFIAHRIFGGANVPIFENVANMGRLPARGANVFAVPMKIKGGSGAPLRIFAELP